MKKVFKVADSLYRAYLAGDMYYDDFRQAIICLTVNGDFRWKSRDHRRIFEWFCGEV